MTIHLCGYALPWNLPAYVDGLVETVAPNAVSAATARNVMLLCGHDVDGMPVCAQTRDGTLSLCADEYGLGFIARMNSGRAGHRGLAAAVERGDVDRCSVNFTSMSRHADGRITWATIDHIALVSEAAYEDTGCWVTSQPFSARSPRIRDMSGAFARRRTAAPPPALGMLRPSSAAPLASASFSVAGHRRPSVPASVNSILAKVESGEWRPSRVSDFPSMLRPSVAEK